MRIGLVGSGGREHAMAKVITRQKAEHSLFIFGSSLNPGIQAISSDIEIGNLNNVTAITDYFVRNRVDVVIIGPEVPLMNGLVDELRATGIPAVGPTKAQAQLEGSKAFMRNLLTQKVGWGSPEWKLVNTKEEARLFIQKVGEVAVKPVGLTGGKGVRVMGVHLQNLEEAVQDASEWIEKNGVVLLEERLVGEEFSRIVFVSDGKLAPMPVAQDFKYAFDGERGNMTGGMGAYTLADGSMPFLPPAALVEADKLMKEVVSALEAETSEKYRGFLYGQFMLTAKGIRVIEFNVRLGDPEGINEMSLLQSDAPRLFLEIATGQLDPSTVKFAPVASVVKYLVPADYPDNGPDPVHFNLDIAEIEKTGMQVVYASVAQDGDGFRTLGSRTLAVVGLGTTPGDVSTRIENLLLQVEPVVLRHRKDVGDGNIIQQRTDRMQKLVKGVLK